MRETCQGAAVAGLHPGLGPGAGKLPAMVRGGKPAPGGDHLQEDGDSMKIPVGKESFEEIRRDRSCYVDKTGFL